MAFEEEFGVEIPDDQAETIVTVGDAVKFLEKATAANDGARLVARCAIWKGRRKSGPCRVGVRRLRMSARGGRTAATMHSRWSG